MWIDQARADDIDQMVELDALITGDRSRRSLITQAVEEQHSYVARHADQIVGFVLTNRHFFGQPFIELVLVHPAFQRHGIGTALMQQIEEVCTPGKLFTSTNASNTPMQRLCERLGFVCSGSIEHLDEGDPELIYFKHLSRATNLNEEAAPS